MQRAKTKKTAESYCRKLLYIALFCSSLWSLLLAIISAIKAVCSVEFRLSPWSVLFSISVIKSVFEYCAKRSVSSGGGSSAGGFLGARLAFGFALGADSASTSVDSAFGLALGFTRGGTRVFGTGGGCASGTEAELPGSAGSSGTGS